MDDDLRAYLQGVKDQVHAQYEVIDDRYKSVESNINTLYDVYGGDKDPDVYLEVQHPCWSCNSNSSSANASAGVR